MINHRYLECFFKVCKDNNIDIKSNPNNNIDYAFIKDLNGNIIKMDKDLKIIRNN